MLEDVRAAYDHYFNLYPPDRLEEKFGISEASQPTLCSNIMI